MMPLKNFAENKIGKRIRKEKQKFQNFKIDLILSIAPIYWELY